MIYKNNMTCPVCDKGKLESIQKNLHMHWKDIPMTFPLAEVFCCDVCPEEFLNLETREMIKMEIKRLRSNETRD